MGIKHILPLPVKHGLRKLGADIKSARRRRRIATALMSERANISRATTARNPLHLWGEEDVNGQV